MSVEHFIDIREVRALTGILSTDVLASAARIGLYLTNRHRRPGTPEIAGEELFGANRPEEFSPDFPVEPDDEL